MKPQRSIRPGVDLLESKTLLSAGVSGHLVDHPHAPSAVADVARPAVHLTGYIYTGTGTVMPMGGVHGSINVAQKTMTLSNGRGTVKIQLTQVHKYPHTLTARAYKILKGTGGFKFYRGQGHTSFTAVTIGKRPSTWTASFF